jgi:hypothetical protein
MRVTELSTFIFVCRIDLRVSVIVYRCVLRKSVLSVT